MIQIIGRTGMLGSKVLEEANRRSIEVDRGYIDILTVKPEDIKSDIVINCAAITTPTGNDKSKMIQINQNGPRRLAHACDESDSKARMVHISTDAVFNRPGPHSERDYCDPSSSYGRTKMNGEIRNTPHLTVRTSFVGFGRHGILKQLIDTDDIIKASNKFLWSGHIVSVVASIVLDLAIRKDITGLIHVPGEFQTRYQLILRLIDILGIDKSRVCLDDSYITDRRLVSSRWSAIKLQQPPSFEDQLVELYHEYTDLYRYSSRSASTSQRMAP